MLDLPLPPPHLRALVSRPGADDFDHVHDLDVLDVLDPAVWRSVLDFGCGPGRIARALLRRRPPPGRYVGVDLDRRVIDWCLAHLAPAAATRGLAWAFVHHDVRHPDFNPPGRAEVLPLPMFDRTASLVIAHSVFTHLIERQVLQYLHEAGRVLTIDGRLYATWFLLDRADWPMLAPSHALYTSPDDPTTAVIYDRTWVRETARSAGLSIVRVLPPAIRGGHWRVVMARADAGLPEADWPPLDAVVP